MMKYFIIRGISTLLIVILAACSTGHKEDMSMTNKIAQFAPTEIKYDDSLLNERQKKVVENLYDASRIIDDLFLEQVYEKNAEIKGRLGASADEKTQLDRQYFEIMFGPFDRLDHNKPFIGSEQKPLGANFYPADLGKEEFESWIKDHPEDEKSFTSEFTVIRRKGDKLVAIPYSEYYKDKLAKVADCLNKAAGYADNPSLKKYLETRAAAFLSNDYYESDLAWMDLKDHTIEIVIGPYEVYEDELFNYKAAFESFLTIMDPEESKNLEIFADHLVDIEKNLPIPDRYKNFERGSESPIVVVQEIFAGGDTKAGIQTLAFNLPNDERVREAKGSKKVMLKNIHEAKFEKLLTPIAAVVLDQQQLSHVTFAGFFKHTLMHEISHGVGPGNIMIDGRKTDVKKELKETYSSLEECKADVLGMYNNIFMIEKGVFPETFASETYVTFLAGVFRSVRFGINEAHGAGTAIIYNYFLEKGGYQYDPATQKVRVNFDKIYDNVTELAAKILTLQAEGDYKGARDLIATYAVLSPSLETMRQKLSGLPVDIRPVFQIEKQIGN
jgi:hypothetical protein